LPLPFSEYDIGNKTTLILLESHLRNIISLLFDNIYDYFLIEKRVLTDIYLGLQL
jgi:hypothetical protein